MTNDKKIFLVRMIEDYKRDDVLMSCIDKQVELTSEELEQQFLSKELVLRKLAELEVERGKLTDLLDTDSKSGFMLMNRDEIGQKLAYVQSKIDIAQEILNECSAKENSLLKKLGGFYDE